MATTRISRRRFGATAAAAAASLLVRPSPVAAALTAAEQANVTLVNEFCAAFATRDISKVLAFMAADVSYRMTETTPAAAGHEGVTTRLKAYLESSERVEFKVLDTYAVGPMVVNHRIDTFASATRPLVWEGVGIFFVKDGKIREWNDYTIKVSR
jgi:limonene-1,2-epoxide hydrolase